MSTFTLLKYISNSLNALFKYAIKYMYANVHCGSNYFVAD